MKKALGVNSIHDLTAIEISDQAWEMEAKAAELPEPEKPKPTMMNQNCYSALVERWQEKLTAQEMHFCSLLIHAHDDTHVSAFAFPGLAALWRCDLRHAKAKVSRLREVGVLVVGKEDGPGRSRNTYRLECCPSTGIQGTVVTTFKYVAAPDFAPAEDDL